MEEILTELFRHIEDERRKGQTNFYMNFTDELKPYDNNDFCNLFVVPEVTSEIVESDETNAKVIYKITEYPGTRVANAYLSGNTVGLTSDEKKLYPLAAEIANTAKRYSLPAAQERFIYDLICGRVTFYDEENKLDESGKLKSFNTAIGALVDRKANDKGIADAFYMLCRMCDLNVSRIGGYIGTTPHTWNTITFEDGRSYCVDVTDGINTGLRSLLNAPLEVIQKTHRCDWELIPNLQQTVDSRYGMNSSRFLLR